MKIPSLAPDRSSATSAPQRQAPRPWLFYRVKRWYSEGQARVEEVTRPFGMTTGDYAMLATLDRKGPCSAAELSRIGGVTPQGVTQQVVQLESKGLVVRYENEANRRIILIEVSELGRENLRRIDAQVAELERAIFAGLPAEHEAVIKAFLSNPPLPPS